MTLLLIAGCVLAAWAVYRADRAAQRNLGSYEADSRARLLRELKRHQ